MQPPRPMETHVTPVIRPSSVATTTFAGQQNQLRAARAQQQQYRASHEYRRVQGGCEMGWLTVKPSPARAWAEERSSRNAFGSAPAAAPPPLALEYLREYTAPRQRLRTAAAILATSADGGEQGGGMCRSGGAQQPERLRERTSCSASATGQVIRTALQQAHRRTMIGAWAAKRSM